MMQEPFLRNWEKNMNTNNYKIISENAYKYLKDEGILIIEIGYNQKNKVIDLLEKTKKYIKINCIKDYSKNDRIIIAKKV